MIITKLVWKPATEAGTRTIERAFAGQIHDDPVFSYLHDPRHPGGESYQYTLFSYLPSIETTRHPSVEALKKYALTAINEMLVRLLSPASDQQSEVVHIRKPSRKVWRRNGVESVRTDKVIGGGTYCGAEPTDYDWAMRDATSEKHQKDAEEVCCPECLRLAREARDRGETKAI